MASPRSWLRQQIFFKGNTSDQLLGVLLLGGFFGRSAWVLARWLPFRLDTRAPA